MDPVSPALQQRAARIRSWRLLGPVAILTQRTPPPPLQIRRSSQRARCLQHGIERVGMCSHAPRGSLHFLLRSYGGAVPIDDMKFKLRVFPQECDDLDDVVDGLPLGLVFRLGTTDRSLQRASTLWFRRTLPPIRGTGSALGERSVPHHCPLD